MDDGKTKHTICIVVPNKGVYSETFIQAHIDQLPASVVALYGYPLPRETSEGESLRSSGLSYRILNMLGVNYLGYSDGWYQQRKLRQYLLLHDVKAVLAEYGHTGVAMMEVCKDAGIPLVVHFHGHDAYSKKILDNEGRGYPELFRNAAAIIGVSQEMYHQLVQLGAPSDKIFINPYGVAVSEFYGADPANADPIFISVGRFVDKKAPHLTIIAFYQVLESHPGARLVMIGDGPLLEACQQLAKALAIADAVEFRGACSHGEIAEELRLARAFVQHSMRTSYGDSEGTPVAILEASGAGLPVVATRHAGIQDVVVDGETGILVDEGDVHGMAEAMLQLVQKPSFAARLGKQGRERVEKEYSMAKSIHRLWTIIEYAINMFQGIHHETG